MGKLRALSRELGAEIVYFNVEESNMIFDNQLESDVEGLYIPELKIIYIRDDLTLLEQENVLLHELGHCHYGHTHYSCHAKMYSSKQEAEANYYMAAYRFSDWLLTWDFAPHPNEVKVEQFMNAYDLSKSMRWICEQIIDEYSEEYLEAI